jgi:hypothetical protein
LVNPSEATVGSGSKYIADFQVGGASKMVINNSGSVGIGTTGPGAQLETKSSAAGTVASIFRGAAAQTADLTQWMNSDGTVLSRVDKDGKFYGDGTGLTGVSATDNTKVAKAGDSMNGSLSLTTNSASTAVAVNQVGAGYAATFMGGNVGIGTSSPSAKLDVSGNILSNNINQWFVQTGALGTAVNDYVEIGTLSSCNGTVFAELDLLEGQAGMGIVQKYILSVNYDQPSTWTIANPISNSGPRGGSHILEVSNNGNTSASFRIRRLTLGTMSTGFSVNLKSLRCGATNTTFTVLSGSGNEAAPSTLFTPSAVLTQVFGNVGIGTTGPAVPLHIQGDNGLRITNTANDRNFNFYFNGGISPTIENPTGNHFQFTNTANTGFYFTAGGHNVMIMGQGSGGARIEIPAINGAWALADLSALKVNYPNNQNNTTNIHGLKIPTANVDSGAGTITNAYGLNVEAPTGATNNYAAAFTGGNVGIGTAAPSAKLEVSGGNIAATSGQIYSGQYIVAAGRTVDFNNGNVQVLDDAALGGTDITLNNMKDGASYTVIIGTDTTSRTYTFTNCTNTHYRPANAPTTNGKATIYTLLKVTRAAATHCYISWIAGFDP